MHKSVAAFWTLVSFACKGCSGLGPPPVIEAPVDYTGRYKAAYGVGVAECKDISGLFSIESEVMVYDSHGVLRESSSGDSMQFLEIFRFGLLDPKFTVRSEAGASQVPVAGTFQVAHTQSDVFLVSCRDLSTGDLLSTSFSSSLDDFKCDDGFIILPEEFYRGGGDGASINFRIYRHLGLTNGGNLMAYEQRHLDGVVEHWYFVFDALTHWLKGSPISRR